jgi:hypothetical protein
LPKSASSASAGERQKQRLRELELIVEKNVDASRKSNQSNPYNDESTGTTTSAAAADISDGPYNDVVPPLDLDGGTDVDHIFAPLAFSSTDSSVPDFQFWTTPSPALPLGQPSEVSFATPVDYNHTTLPTFCDVTVADHPAGQNTGHSAMVKVSDPLTSLSARTLCRFLLGNEKDADKLSMAFQSGNVNLRDIILAGISAVGFSHLTFSETGYTSPMSQITFQEKSSSASRLYLPDPQANMITVSKMSLYAACMENARMMGISRESAFEENRESPFYQAFLCSNDVATVKAQFSYLAPDLRPSTAQIQNRHFLWIDLLPFPEFRDRLLALKQVGESIFDESELCHDIDEGGVICWGRNGHNFGSPWDRRNWELKHEFLKKWWMITGGADGELWKQSRWWAETRGEKWGS